jgi:hypothetical protein
MRLVDTSWRGRVLSTVYGGGLSLVLLAGPAAAEQGTLNPHLQAAYGLHEALDYDEALRALGKARKWPSNTREDRVSIELLEGILSFESSQAKRGRSAFQRALALDPKATLPVAVSPKVTEALEQVRARLPASAPPVVLETHEPAPAPMPVVSEAPLAPPPPQVEVVRESGGGSSLRLPVAIGGGVVAVGGALAWGRARALSSRVRDADPSITTRAQLDSTLNQGRTFEKVGWALMGLGAATAVGSLLFLGDSMSATHAAILPTPEGAHLSLTWSLR